MITNPNQVGFRLVKNSNSIEFFPKFQALTNIWTRQLAKKLNQIGFNKIYDPIRKLGSGASAKVYEVVRPMDDKHFAVKAFTKNSTLNS